jgi:hypothetical protein
MTPWRVTMIAHDLNGLVNCMIVQSLAPPPSTELANADWIKPGRAVWHLSGSSVATEVLKKIVTNEAVTRKKNLYM